ncbi:hypothetical protein [Natrinema versiforme]|uniref:Uncharacterized protein n=1 Tax=Natrinema versiforme JCM 10478 TaxID=1227496 RepID=L9XR09_9EURY|nr:hypothetical protein [Natrinema versiforme]ELY63962.1 hypothetical protein C489_17982 [Natrinema versiforme JCM 10478]
MGSARSNTSDRSSSLQSRGYHITVDDGRDSFFALSIEDPTSEDAWLMSDTVVSLEEMR